MAEHKKKSAAVVNYILILFFCAFCLMMMSYFMEQRSVAESLDGLRSSVSAMKTVDELYEENDSLKESLNSTEKDLIFAEKEVQDLQEDIEILEETIETLQQTAFAMDLFWQINEAYTSGKSATCLNLIEALEEAGLEGYLPMESVNQDLRSAPAYRYSEIKEQLGLIAD